MTLFVDVHAHLTHEAFAFDLEAVIARAQAAGLRAIVVNGLEPVSNRRILALAGQYPIIKPALGIYPIDAVNALVANLPFEVPRFDVDVEIAFIRAQAAAGKLVAIGECGLDGHWVGETCFAEQERVFVALIEVAVTCDLPLIIHTRKREQRAMEILAHHGVTRVDFHCYGGRTKAAIRAAHDRGWWFSIPANARINEAFRKLLKELPLDRILTETDCPYLPPVRGNRNEPANVVDTVSLLAELRSLSPFEAASQVSANYDTLFRS